MNKDKLARKKEEAQKKYPILSSKKRYPNSSLKKQAAAAIAEADITRRYTPNHLFLKE